MDEDTADFEIDHNFTLPEPFDRSVANVQMRNVSNNVSEGLDLEVTVTFGSDEVEIRLDDESIIEAKFDIYRAMVIATPYNCQFSDVGEIVDHSGYKGTQTYSSSSESKHNRQGGASVNAEVALSEQRSKIGVQGGAETTTSSVQSNDDMLHAERPFNQVAIGNDDITIYANPNGTPLEGVFVDHTVCFRALPENKSKPFGVALRLQAKKNWIKLTDIGDVTFSKRLKKFSHIIKGSNPADDFHREAFQLLLNHLVFHGLQDSNEGQTATLAARAVKALPIRENDAELRFARLSLDKRVVPVKELEAVLIHDRPVVQRILRQYDLELDDSIEVEDTSLFFDPKSKALDADRTGLSIDIAVRVALRAFPIVSKKTELQTINGMDSNLLYISPAILAEMLQITSNKTPQAIEPKFSEQVSFLIPARGKPARSDSEWLNAMKQLVKHDRASINSALLINRNSIMVQLRLLSIGGSDEMCVFTHTFKGSWISPEKCSANLFSSYDVWAGAVRRDKLYKKYFASFSN
ncbi:hypothetical protein SLH49_11545 [Cognatiyoonia sp. IB215446]|uniref:hypothetical protein n=1 Tax=Cognatiyoonia sp. IB215446 TaxID=3097355 RepID=UPI002A10A1E9|nr:hypothetical protein [Cognatiyoonia sp. IB215446]MDX8348618.1 hypothetical protein [Cognatiyoonia sp. IB215446]